LLVERKASAPHVIALAGGEPIELGPATAFGFAVAADDWSRVAMMTSANEIAVPAERDGDPPRALARTEKAIAYLAISPRGDTVVVHDGITIWTLPFAGGPLRELAHYADKLTTVTWSPDGKTLAIGGHLPEILVIDTATGAQTVLRGHSDRIYTLAFSRDGTRLLSASDDATARVWNLATHSALVLRGHDDDVYRARFSADERSVATSSLDGSARVWRLDSPSTAVLVERDPIDDLWFAGDRLAVRTKSSLARWDLAAGRREEVASWARESDHLGYGIASHDGSRVAIPNADGSLALRGAGHPAIALRGHRGLITHVEFARDDRAVFSSSSDGTLRRWDAATGDSRVVLESTTPIRGFAVARDGRMVAQTGDLTYAIDPAGRVSKLGKGPAWCISLAEFEPVSDRLVAQRCDNSLAIIDGNRMIELPTGGYAMARIAVSPDGRWMAGGLADRTIRLWSTETGRVVDVLRGHSDFVLDVAFSPDGRQLASASYDKTIRLWDLATRQHRVLRGHTAEIKRVMWRDADHLVTGSIDGTVRLWDAPSLELPTAFDLARRLDAATTARIALDRPSTGLPPSRGT
ncbi:MAG TPA: WD40 repeat domain-containing protein, partial [Kofleriaceae bacterium]